MKRSKKKLVLIFQAISLFLFSNAGAATIYANSCSQSDVQAKIDSAGDGDTVIIPAGNCTWNSSVTVDLSFGKSLTLSGPACTLDKSGRPMSCPTTISGSGISVRGAHNKIWRISSLHLKGAAGIEVFGQAKDWRIDHVYFDSSTGYVQERVIWIQGSGGPSAYTTGLIDHCTFYHPLAIQVHTRGNNTTGGNADWARPLGLGTYDAVYIEDSDFIFNKTVVSAPTTDCDGGGGFVFRHNNVVNSYLEMHDAIVTNNRGCKKWEIYNNTFTNIVDSGISTNMHLRSGTGVVFNNSCTNAPDNEFISMSLYRSYQTGGDPWNTLCGPSSGKAILNTENDYPRNCSSGAGCVDKDGSGPGGYPCRDQIGQTGNGKQVTVPGLFWNNSVNGAYVEPKIISGENYYKKGIDYCSNASASMPVTCNGVSVNYSSYTYPHPLAQGDIAPPRNLRILE